MSALLNLTLEHVLVRITTIIVCNDLWCYSDSSLIQAFRDLQLIRAVFPEMVRGVGFPPKITGISFPSNWLEYLT